MEPLFLILSRDTMNKPTLSILLLAAATSACDAGPTGGNTSVPRPGTPDAAMQDLARGIAAAMADPEIREDVRDAMRASLITQHRLVLHEYLASPEADDLVAGVAQALGSDPAAVRTLAAQLPDADFFVPARQDRRTWKATPNLVVTGLLQRPEHGFSTGFRPGGTRTRVAFNRANPGVAVFQISPTEFRGRRIDPQANVPGDVIEEANDGVISGRYIWTPVDGTPVTIELADLDNSRAVRRPKLNESCGPEALVACDGGESGGSGGRGGGGSTAPADTTFLDHYYLHYPDGCGDPDPTFRATHYNAAGVATGTGELQYEEVPRFTPFYPDAALLFRRITEGTSERIFFKIIDRDGWFCGGNDEKGSRNFYASDRGQIRTIYKNGTATANIALDWTPKY
jgi:hypothetical protein